MAGSKSSSVKTGKQKSTHVSLGKRLKKKYFGRKGIYKLYLFALFPVLFILVFNYFPMYGILVAFKDFSIRKGIMGSDWVGLK